MRSAHTSFIGKFHHVAVRTSKARNSKNLLPNKNHKENHNSKTSNCVKVKTSLNDQMDYSSHQMPTNNRRPYAQQT